MLILKRSVNICTDSVFSFSFNKLDILTQFLLFPLVLLELKEFVHPSQVQPAEETEPCDTDQANLQERTPTPNSAEVREN